MKEIQQRLCDVRKKLIELKIDGIIVPSNDPHFSEYVADRWKCREWLSGFTGSAGTLVVTGNSAALWTDSRYFLQAEEQLKESGIELKRMGLPDVESIEAYLKKEVQDSGIIGIDGNIFSVSDFQRISSAIKPLTLKIQEDFFNDCWDNRPDMPNKKAFILPVSIAGKSIAEKIGEVINGAPLTKEDIYLITALDEVAWLFNLRGADIDYNPLALAYGAIGKSFAYLFIDSDKLSDKDCEELQRNGVEIMPYVNFRGFVEKIDVTKNVMLNPRKTSVIVYKQLLRNSINIIEDYNPNGIITSLKGIKNSIEIEGFKRAMIEDGVALVRFYKWLDENIGKEEITECQLAKKLFEFRAMSPSFVGESFASIVGYKEHGAIVHYFPTSETDIPVGKDGFLLIDSGGQYKNGTTDITRTIHLGKPTRKERNDYTLVLKGMIDLAKAIFPTGTRGSQLDILARAPMLANCINYGHGTGHGIGHFLNVHEGPQSIRMQENPVTLKPGMVTSDEPGIYRAGEYGIRTENLILCVNYQRNEFGTFERFETLTLCPIDKRPIEREMLTYDEIEWLNDYHKNVYETLRPYLNASEQEWLRDKTNEM